MMSEYIYAVINSDGIVENIVTADNKDALAPLRLLIPDAADIVLTTAKTGAAYIGGDIHGTKFRMPSPYQSWVWDDASWSWQAPIPYPDGGNGFTWDESSVSWVPIPEAEPALTPGE